MVSLHKALFLGGEYVRGGGRLTGHKYPPGGCFTLIPGGDYVSLTSTFVRFGLVVGSYQLANDINDVGNL